VRIIETGVHTIAADGRRRHDRHVQTFDGDGQPRLGEGNGERTTRLWFPDGSGSGERIEINHMLGVAQRGPAGARFAPHALERPAVDIRRVSPDSLAFREMMDTVLSGEVAASEDLGARAVGPLLLHGHRAATPATNGWPAETIDTWYYNLPDGESIVMEVASVATFDDGRAQHTNMRIVRAIRTVVPGSRFSVPRDLRVQNLWEGGR